MSDKLIVQGLHSADKAPLDYYPNGSFAIHWAKNSAYEISLTAIDDKSLAFSMLGVEASLYWQGQEFIIKNCVDDYTGGVVTKAITASHVYAECSRFRQHQIKTGTLTYTVEQVLSFVFDKNPLGFTYQVIGDFDKQQISDLGNCSGQEALSKIVDAWPDAIIYPDNKKIRVYSHAAFVKDHGNRIDYLNNANSVKLSNDSTEISNQALVSGMQKENSDTEKPEYYFQPFTVTDKASVTKWGLHETEDISDERFNNKGAMQTYALSKLSPEPALTIEITEDTNEKPIAGDIRRLEIRPQGIVTKVEIVEFTYYPLDKGVNTTISLNNTAKTILDYQRRAKLNTQEIINSQRNRIVGLTQDLNNKYTDLTAANKKLSVSVGNLNTDNKDLKETIEKLQKEIEEIKNSSGGGGTTPPSNWKSGTMFMDIADYQSGFTQATYNELYSKGIKGVIIKLTQGSQAGTAYINSYFNQQKSRATSAGMKFIGTYHYLVSTGVADAQDEARWYLKQLQANNVPKSTIVACDLEDPVLSSNKTTLTAELAAFHKVLTDAGYTNTADYSSTSWMTARFTPQGKYKWIASWGLANPPAGADAWQFNNTFNGISLDVDKSYNQAFI